MGSISIKDDRRIAELFLKSSCGCYCCGNMFTNRQSVYKIDGEFYCNDCADKAEGKKSNFKYIVIEGLPRVKVDAQNPLDIPFGISKVSLSYNVPVIWEFTAVGFVQKSIEYNWAVVEKRADGIVVLFPKNLIASKYEFDYQSEKYKCIRTFASDKENITTEYLCDGDNVIGTVHQPYEKATKSDIRKFAICDKDIRSFDIGQLREAKSNPTIEAGVAIALKKVSPADMLRYFDKKLIGQDMETKKIVYMFYEYMRRVAEGKPFTAPNWMLTAPSGCGKTEVYRILRDFFKEYNIPIPIFQFDMSHFTEAGYRGKEVTEILDTITKENSTTDGVAICFMDEADKKCIPSIGTQGIDFNAAFQSNLLTFIEGSVHTVSVSRLKGVRKFDTGKTMFVLMGAFQDIRDSKHKKATKTSSFGFGADIEHKPQDNIVDDSFYDDISIDDMVEFGMLEELAGRMEQVVNLHKLSVDDMEDLIADKAQKISEEMGIPIELTSEAIDSLLEISYSNLGVRRVINCIKSLVGNALAEVYFDDDFDRSSHHILITSKDNAEIEENLLYPPYETVF